MEERIRMERESVINQCTGESESLKSVEVDTKLGLSLLKPDSQSPVSYYTDLINEVKNLLDGLIDSVTFEENVRCVVVVLANKVYSVIQDVEFIIL